MPTYTYTCPSCGDFELYSSLQGYKEKVRCPSCTKQSQRNLLVDAMSVIATGLGAQTLGSIADKNADKLSQDEKDLLNAKHNAYKDVPEEQLAPLPAGMKRVGRPKEGVQWVD